MMDTNGNGMIDQEEIDRMPSFVRDMMKSRGIELKPGMSADDMRNSFRAGGGENNGWPGGPNNGGNGNSNPENVKPPLKPYKMKEKPPIIQALPPAYSEVDADFDGQLGLDEWMLARRVALEQFDALDTDHDGFLIPEELQAAEATATTANAAMAVRTEKLQIVSAKFIVCHEAFVGSVKTRAKSAVIVTFKFFLNDPALAKLVADIAGGKTISAS